MATIHPSHLLELESERCQLRKADADIESGRERLRAQQQLLETLRASGHDVPEAQRLVDLLANVLVEWERHRTQIEYRVAYLERAAARE
jgi:hypothetical protein